MAAPRAAALLIGLGLLAAAAAPLARASEPERSESPPALSPTLHAAASEPAAQALRLPAAERYDSGPSADSLAPDGAARAAGPGRPVSGSIGAEIPLPPDVSEAMPRATAADRLRAALAERLGVGGPGLEAKIGPPRLNRREREAIASFYALGDFQPLWIRDGAWTPAAARVIERLKAAAEDGLDATDYPVPAIRVTSRGDSPADLAEAEIRLAASIVLYARDARGGRLDPPRLSNLITPKLELPAGEAALARVAAAPDPGAALQAYNPQTAGYRALRAKLAEVRARRPDPTPSVRVPAGPALKVGMRDPRVPLVRARFNLPAEDATAYDERLASAVAAFQRQSGLPSSGILGPATVAALQGPSPARIEGDLIANMERWRWLPADLGPRYVAVNVPEFQLKVVEDGRTIHQTRVIVGKPETPTPLFSGTLEYAVVNPSWNVPPSILKNEILPKLAQDPFYAARLGYEVIQRGDQIAVRQPPGERNALGHIKFMFPNQHAVYLHDTPNRNLFGAVRRAFSHGCVRVDQPMRLAEVVLGASWPAERVQRLVGQGERTIHLSRRLPVHLTYFTAVADEHGEIRFVDDLYGTNRKVRAALGLGG